MELLTSVTVSPVFIWCVIMWAKPQVSNRLRAYMRAALPKPHYPDRYSLQAAKEDGLENDSVPGLRNSRDGDKTKWESESVLEELARDLQYIGRRFSTMYDRCAGLISSNRETPDEPLESTRRNAPQNTRSRGMQP